LTRAIELYERAAELGEKDAHLCLATIYDRLGYDEGAGVEKDTAKTIRHYEAAAMRGHVAQDSILVGRKIMPETSTLLCSTGS